MSDQEKIEIRLDLEGETKEMFLEIKRKLNVKANTETIRSIIKTAFDLLFSDNGRV
jgi:hypothetical protein